MSRYGSHRHTGADRRHLAAVVVVTAGVVAAACGVRPDPSPQHLDPATIPLPSEAQTGTALSRPAAAIVYLVADDGVVPVRRLVDAPVSVERLLAALASGPSDRERRSGLRTALTGNIQVDAVAVRPDAIAAVALAPTFRDAGAEEQILALTQLVFTLTEAPGIAAVMFTIDGTTVSVPRADGSLTAVPVTRSDYTRLAATPTS